jgi:type VI secretion system secreted protein Hcp
MLKPKLIALAAATVTALAAAPSAHAATDYFMRIDPVTPTDQIQGESVDQTYKGYIQLKSFSFDVENATTVGSATGGAGAGKAKLGELTVEKNVDSTTPQLLQRLAQGSHFAGIEIVARKAGGAGAAPAANPTSYYFSMAFPTSQEQSGDAGDDAPQEKLTFAYGGIGQKVNKPGPGGAAGTSVFGSWSQITNSATLDKVPADWTK